MNASQQRSNPESNTIRCPKCGNRIWKTAKFCTRCGQSFSPVAGTGASRAVPTVTPPPTLIQPHPARRGSSGNRKAVVGFLAGVLSMLLLLACALTGYFLFRDQLGLPALGVWDPSSTSPRSELSRSNEVSTSTPIEIISQTQAPYLLPIVSPTSTLVPIFEPTITAFIIPAATPTPEYPPEFYDTFDNGISPLWEFDDGDWVTMNGMLVNMDDVSRALVGDPQWRNYALDVDVIEIEDGSCNFLVAYIDYEYVAMKVDSHGWIAWSHLETTRLSEVEFPFHLRLELRAELVTAYVNGVPVGTASIPGIDHGLAGIWCYRGDYGDSGLLDNFLVSPLP